MSNVDKRRKRLIELHQMYAATFSGDAGEKVLKDLEAFCFYNRPLVSHTNIDVNRLLWLEGARAVFLHIKAQLERNLEEEK